MNIMHAWEAVDLRINLAQKNHGYSISAQSYNFCPHMIKLDILDFTLSLKCAQTTNQKVGLIQFLYDSYNIAKHTSVHIVLLT